LIGQVCIPRQGKKARRRQQNRRSRSIGRRWPRLVPGRPRGVTTMIFFRRTEEEEEEEEVEARCARNGRRNRRRRLWR
jgi:hypothetical protein